MDKNDLFEMIDGVYDTYIEESEKDYMQKSNSKAIVGTVLSVGAVAAAISLGIGLKMNRLDNNSVAGALQTTEETTVVEELQTTEAATEIEESVTEVCSSENLAETENNTENTTVEETTQEEIQFNFDTLMQYPDFVGGVSHLGCSLHSSEVPGSIILKEYGDKRLWYANYNGAEFIGYEFAGDQAHPSVGEWAEGHRAGAPMYEKLENNRTVHFIYNDTIENEAGEPCIVQANLGVEISWNESSIIYDDIHSSAGAHDIDINTFFNEPYFVDLRYDDGNEVYIKDGNSIDVNSVNFENDIRTLYAAASIANAIAVINPDGTTAVYVDDEIDKGLIKSLLFPVCSEGGFGDSSVFSQAVASVSMED